MRKRLRKSNDAVFDGVCGGIAKYIGVDPTWVRFIFLIVTFATVWSILIYIAFILSMPEAKNGN
ncbi:PspC domain-containing protein [Candidatus Pacearchaeota archaeon]|nr:PspC domain-containing protein [Candidatus Pacearchaeota archaeon]